MFKLPFGVDIKNLIDDLRIISWEACDILNYYSKRINDGNFDKELIKYKDSTDPVTIADLKVNDLVISEINKRYLNKPWCFLSEERGELRGDNNALKNDWLWVLDPLDGTKDFIQNTGEFAMHLALNYKNIPILGVVLIPSLGELWIADGINSWVENRNGIKQKPSLLNRKDISSMTIITSKNHKNEVLNFIIDKLGFSHTAVMGSIGCKIASLMRGDCDVYISLSLPGQSSPKDWDFAAPEVILHKAGGRITNVDNECLIYNKEGFHQQGIIIASTNEYIQEKLCSKIKKIIKEYGIF